MDRLKKYQHIIINYLKGHEEKNKNNESSLIPQLVIDTTQHHYLYLQLGWQNRRFYHSCLFHIDIIDNKIWIQVNNTENLIGNELVQLGIAPEDIVFGYIPEAVRAEIDLGLPSLV